jgi:ethanolamine utilization cobalamin adenosyltransferase
MIINLTNYHDALPILLSDNETFEKLKADFSEILADLTTFKDNPNCSCRGRVFKFFGEKLAANGDILDPYIKDVNSLNAKLQNAVQQKMINTYTGKVFIIDKGEEAWKAFSSTLSTKLFRGFSVVERSDSVAIYFL